LVFDIGGTSTRCALVTQRGECLALASSADPGNPLAGGTDRMVAAVAKAALTALEVGRVAADGIGGFLMAVAGGTEAALEAAHARLRGLGITGRRLDNPGGDGLAAFAAGTWRPTGYALVAGTGAVGMRVENGTPAAVSDGLGWLLGDGGSGFWIGRQAVRAAIGDLRGECRPTALTRLVLGRLDELTGRKLSLAPRPQAAGGLLAAVYEMPPANLGRFAPLVFELPDDQTAQSILAQAGRALADTLRTLVVESAPPVLVLAGGVLANHPELGAEAQGVLDEMAGEVEVSVARDGLVGAAVLALRAAGTQVGPAEFRRVQTSLARLRGPTATPSPSSGQASSRPRRAEKSAPAESEES
jgi:N-acetylglucosamine kinase-like BadF-type ATPase